jgi:hypothetical protein
MSDISLIVSLLFKKKLDEEFITLSPSAQLGA